MRRLADPDATVVIRRLRDGWTFSACAVAALILLVLGAVFFAARRSPSPSGPPLAGEAAILAARPMALLLFRYAPAPAILVADFPSLHAQARALNRAAVFLELAGATRDRVPDDAAVWQAITAAHLDYDRFYYGHDYRAADLHRMWQLQAGEGIALLPEEAELRAGLLAAEAMPGGFGAVISLPPPGTGLQDSGGRAAILRHELSHGRYFTEPGYARAVHVFWQTTLTPAERAGFRRFLAASLYDPSDESLMENETQAYLVHTPDDRFFTSRDAGLDEAAASRLRGAFAAADPPGWR